MKNDGEDIDRTETSEAAMEAIGVAPFQLDVFSTPEGVTVVGLAGEIDLHNAGDFREALARPIDGGADHVIVDATKVTFMDSTALGVYVGAARRLPSGGALFVACNGDVRRLFEIVGLERSFRLVDSVEEARQALSP